MGSFPIPIPLMGFQWDWETIGIPIGLGDHWDPNGGQWRETIEILMMIPI